jgi:hypothetical protein
MAAAPAVELELDFLVWKDKNGTEQTTPAHTFPSGTRMFFQQSTAPVGWTKEATHNNKALRLVSGSVSSGGSQNFSTVFGKSATDGHTLTEKQIPAHNHTVNTGGGHGHTLKTTWYNWSKAAQARNWSNTTTASPGISRNYYPIPLSTINNTSAITGGSHSHTTKDAGSGNSHSHSMDIRVKYLDVILAVKD